jgi:agmatine deiminase
MTLIKSTPKKDGFRFPGEFEPHSGCWLQWPDRSDIYPFGAKLVQRTYVKLATLISKYEQVTMCVSKAQYQNARMQLPDDIRLVEMSYDGNWLRDTGPSFVVNNSGEIRGIDWEFNAWGGLQDGAYFPWDQDNLVAKKIMEIEGIDRYKCNMVLEGGAFHSDGEGTLLITEESIINDNRNPSLTREEIEHNLKEYIGVDKVIWFKRGIYLDEAGGHIDGLCCFIKPGVVALHWTEDKNDPQYEISFEAYQTLLDSTDAKGRKFEIQKIHQPGPLYITKEESEWTDSIEGTVPRDEGDRLPGTYINFYFANDAVIVPTFDDEFDNAAIDTLQKLLPNKKVIPFFSRDILLGGGNIHCMVQQLPKTK